MPHAETIIMQVSATLSTARTVPAVTAKQIFSAYTVETFTQSIQQQVCHAYKPESLIA